MSKEPFHGLKYGPQVLGTIRADLRDEPENTTVQQVVDNALADYGYRLSPKQQALLPNIARVQKHMQAVQSVSCTRNRDSIQRLVALNLGASPNSVKDLHFHTTSITAVFRQDEFEKLFFSTMKKEGLDSEDALPPEGFTGQRLRAHTRNGTIPLSAMGAKSGKVHTASHEDLHVQYRYLHPESVPPQNSSYKDYLLSLQEGAANALQQSDKKGFTEAARKATAELLYTFLTELHSFSLSGEKDVYNMFFRHHDPAYDNFKEKIKTTIVSAIPPTLPENTPWKNIVDCEFIRAEHQACFINTEYLKLVDRGYSGERLAAIVGFLTPKQGYVIKAYTVGDPTFSKLKKWKREYEHGYLKNPTSQQKIPSGVDL